jgi:hypothetical protein
MVAFSDVKVEGGRLQGKAAKVRERPLTMEEKAFVLRDLKKLEAQDVEVAREIMVLLEPLLRDEVEGYTVV